MVTGATDGIGREYAKQLAQRGINIVLVSRSLDKLTEMANELGNKCVQFAVLKTFIQSEKS